MKICGPLWSLGDPGAWIQLSHHYEKVQNKAVPCKRSDSHGEGPSATKGKGIDPHMLVTLSLT